MSSLLAERAVLIACMLLLAAFLMMFWDMEAPARRGGRAPGENKVKEK